jgi:hypothetical protein
MSSGTGTFNGEKIKFHFPSEKLWSHLTWIRTPDPHLISADSKQCPEEFAASGLMLCVEREQRRTSSALTKTVYQHNF